MMTSDKKKYIGRKYKLLRDMPYSVEEDNDEHLFRTGAEFTVTEIPDHIIGYSKDAVFLYDGEFHVPVSYGGLDYWTNTLERIEE